MGKDSALRQMMERYDIRTDPDIQIINYRNKWGDEQEVRALLGRMTGKPDIKASCPGPHKARLNSVGTRSET